MGILSIFKKKKIENIYDPKKKKYKIGLALGGGGARGFAHIGAFKAFEEFGLEFDVIAGTSAGSLAGAFLAAGYKYDDFLKFANEIKTKDIKTNKLFFMPSKTNGIEEAITSRLGNIDIKDLKKPFAAVAVDIKTTDEVVITRGNLAKAVAGSCCVPGVFQPVEFEDMILCDGGLQNTLPANVPRLMGCDYVVSVDVNPERTYGTESTKILDVIGVTIRTLMKSNVLKGYLNSDVVIKPDTKRFKSTKLNETQAMIEEGYMATLEKMPEIMKLFSHDAKIKKEYTPPEEEIKILK